MNEITLRDYLAAHALLGILSNRSAYYPTEEAGEGKQAGVLCARYAYETADAMLAEREKGKPAKRRIRKRV